VEGSFCYFILEQSGTDYVTKIFLLIRAIFLCRLLALVHPA
jgi:hypothetical protein